MTVGSIDTDNATVYCVRFEDKKIQRGGFVATTLEK